MGKLRSSKQQAVHSTLNTHRWKSRNPAKENIIPATASGSASNSELHVQLHATTDQLLTLREEHAHTTLELSLAHNNLATAHATISEQADTIKQKNQRINRLMRDKSVYAAKLSCLKQELLQTLLRAQSAESQSNSSSLRIETLLRTVERLNRTVDTQNGAKTEMQKRLKAVKMRENRAKDALSRTRKSLKMQSTWAAKNRYAYKSQYRSLVLACTRAGIAQSRVGRLLTRIGRVFNVKVTKSASRRTVGRIITEAGIKVRIQLGHELAPLALSSDGTSVRNVNYEARHITYEAPTYTSDPNEPQTAFKTRFVEVEHSLDHTAQSQFDGWGITNQKIIETYTNSPLGQRDKIEGVTYEKDDLWRKAFSYHSDHAPDVGACAHKVQEKKSDVIESDLGKEAMEAMTSNEIEDKLWEVVQEIWDDPEGLDPRAIPDELRNDAMQSLATRLGSTAYEELPEARQLILKRFIKAGCWGHKDLNATAGGAKAMEAAWEELGLTPPVLLANKDNAATISLGDDADSDAVQRAVKASKRGAAKLVSICGMLFRNKDDKKGHQDLHRHYFTKVKFDITGTQSTVKFPDIQNARYGTVLTGAAELVTYRPSYIEFLHLIRDSKQTPGLNHSEQNALNGILCDQTMTECCAMTLYKEAFSDAIMAAARTPGINHLDLGSLHRQTVAHLQTVIDNPDLLLDPTTPCSEATVDGMAFRNQFAVDSVHFMASKLPHLEPILVAFLKGALATWTKKTFSSEYDEDGPINSLTPAEKVLYFIPPTNDRNESVFGGLRIHSRYRSASTVAHFSAHTGYHLNETEAFSEAMLNTQEDALYIMRLARAEDASGTMRKFREELLAFKQHTVAAEAREKQKEKEVEAAAEILRLQSIHIITDPDQLKALPVRKKNSASLRDQLDVRRDLWKDEVLVKAKLKDISKKADMLAAILAADQRRNSTTTN